MSNPRFRIAGLWKGHDYISSCSEDSPGAVHEPTDKRGNGMHCLYPCFCPCDLVDVCCLYALDHPEKKP